MECYDGCGAPLINGVCEHCGRTYPDLIEVSFDDIIDDANDRLDKVEEEIVAMGSNDFGTYGTSYSPTWDDEMPYPREFEDTQKTLGVATGAFLFIGAVFGLFAPPLALPFLAIGLLAAITGGIRQLTHKGD